MTTYKPPFTITNTILESISTIMKKIGKLDNFKDFNKMPILRRNSKIHSIHSSLAIEANSLSLNQVKDIIDEKFVMGDQKEIQEVKNAYKAYEMIKDLNPYSIEDLKKVHGVMTFLTLEQSGLFRRGEEGVFDGDNCIFIAPKAEMVEELVNQLFGWMQENKDVIHPLILSSVFHYEFVFIHPFSDGNGRTARLWQNVILTDWEKIFEFVPIESQIKKYQSEYYQAIQNCNLKGDSTEFIEFMLHMMDEVLDELLASTRREASYISSYVNRLLDIMDGEVPMTSKELMNCLGLKSRISFRDNYLKPAIENGFVKMTNPEKPTSRNQRYYKV